MRLMRISPSIGTTASRSEPAATIATVGGTITGVAYLPPKRPKFDSVIV